MSSIYGDIITSDKVEEAMIGHLKTWLPTYLAELERQTGRDPGVLPMVRSWTTFNEFDKWPEDQLPAGIIVSPGLADRPVKDGGGKYRVKYIVGIGVVVSAKDQKATNDLAKLYAGAVTAAVLQHPSLGDFAEGCNWRDMSHSGLPPEDQRTLAVAQAIFEVEVRDALDVFGGPTSPPEDPLAQPSAWPTVDTTSTQVEVKE